MTSLTLVQKPRSGLQAKTSRRAPLACLRCRQRKVRCDVAMNGQPCMNCGLDEESCVVAKRGTRCPSSNHWRSRKCSKDKQHMQTNDAPTQQSSGLTPPQLDAQQSPRSPKGRSDDNVEGLSSSRPSAVLARSDTIKVFCDMLEPSQKYGNDPLNLTMHTEPTRPTNMVVYCSYSFITRADVFYTPVQDIEFLNSEGCFELPAPTILDQFLPQYFTNVHPLLPMLSEQDFWDARSRPDPPQSKMLSLLLVQAMLFAACSFMPLKTINRLGYDSIRSARSAFYRKCKLIYDASLEPSKVATAQAALLLTYWTPPLKADSKPNTMWLMIAIENARRCQADRLSDVSQFSLLPTSEKSTLRRLWWCCIIRDRILPLGLRRCIQITPAHFDLVKNMGLGCRELQAGIRQSRVYCDDTKESLSIIMEHMVKLSTVLTDILLLAFPLKSEDQSKDMLPQVRECKKALAEWYRNSSSLNTVGATIMADRLVVLHINLIYTYYHWATVAMCHLEMRSLEARQLDLDPTADVSVVLRQAQISTIRIVESLDRLNQTGLTRWLPISIVAYAAFPLAVHIFDACSEMPQDTSSRGDGYASLLQQRLCTLIKTMKILHEQYDGVDQVVKSIRHIVEYVRSCAPKYITDATPGSLELPGGSELVLRVSLAMDWILSSGSSSEGEDFTSHLRALFHQPCSNMSSVETNSGQTATRSEDMSGGPGNPASDQPATDWMVNTPPSSTENVGSSISDLLFDPDEFDDSFAERGYQGDWEEESDLEERVEKLLEIGGDLNFDELFATV